GIEARRPRYATGESRARNEFAGLAVENVEKTVLIRLHDYLARASSKREIRLHQRLRRVVVPVVTGRGLEIPRELTVARVDRENRRVEDPAPRPSERGSIPGRAVPRPEIDQLQGGIVGPPSPGGPPPAGLPPLSAPRFRGGFERLRLESLRRISRHRVG